MNLNLLPFAILWAVMALAVIALIVYRKTIASGEDDSLHVMDGDAGMIPRQAAIAHKLETVDRWGKTLTIVTLVYGLLIGGLWTYQSWVAASNLTAQ